MDASLFPLAPSLSAITLPGAINPKVSPDHTKIVFGVKGNPEKNGLWIIETINLPLGFNREPRQITDGNIENFDWQFSFDSREILLTSKNQAFLLKTNEFTSQVKRINIQKDLDKTLALWEQKKKEIANSLLNNIKEEKIKKVFLEKASNISFSPDENKIMYVASESAILEENLVKKIPVASTQKEDRKLVKDMIYIYDIKEDKNFKLSENKDDIFYWLANSINILNPLKDKIVILDYDSTNKIPVYQGSYAYPYALPSPNNNRMFILTNFGGKDLNLYSLSLK